MISRRNRRFLSLAFVLAISPLAAGCEKTPLLAPTGSAIVLTSSATALPVNGTANLIAQVLDQSGYPPHSGTVITFTTTLGTVQPASAPTNSSGLVTVTFNSGTANGTATIVATSGGAGASTSAGTTTGGTTTAATAANTVKIAIGTAAVGRVSVNASPATVPNIGGSTTISASVYDINGNALSSAPVSFTATAGTLSAAVATTGANGVAATILTTSQTSTVTASVGATATPTPTTGGTTGGTTTPAASGAASGSVIVNVALAPTLVITPPTTPPSVGLPASFTFAVTAAAANGSAVRDLNVSWGDGATTNLGAVTGSAIASHTYQSLGTFLVTGTVVDASGNSNPVSTPVTVVPTPRPGIIVTQSPNPGSANTVTTLTIQVTVATGIFVESLTIDFGDGTSASLGGSASAVVPHTYTKAGTYIVTVTVVDSSGQTTIGTAVISIMI